MDMKIIDPLEDMVEEALKAAHISYTIPYLGPDFIIEGTIALEVKAFYTPRIDKQLELFGPTILLQGKPAVEAFCRMINAQAYSAQD